MSETELKLDKYRRFIKRMALHCENNDTSIRVNLRRAYILPTQKGLYYLTTIIIMFVWSINYALSLGYAMTFFTVVFALIVAVLTVGNLSSIRIRPLENSAFFSREPAYFRLQIENQSAQPKIHIKARRNGLYSEPISIKGHEKTVCNVFVNDTSRGIKKLEYVQLSGDYPVGIFSSWTWLYFDTRVIIYPAPEGELPLPFNPSHHSNDEGLINRQGSDDFNDLRDYQPGDSLRHIQWKKMHHGTLRVKTFHDLAGQQCILDFNDKQLSRYDTETRLSQLCQWVLDAEVSGTQYALHLPNQTITASSGHVHQARCLEALACY